MITLPEALNYEIQSSKLAAWIMERTSLPFIQDSLSWYFARKAERKWGRCMALETVKEILEKNL